ncbi:protein BatD [Prolixibacteraceae bacterium JC049]|nr:protein BatD [Prolixibacteraceae bacterium JC049]
MNKRIALIFTVLFLAFQSKADRIKFTMSAPSVVTMNEQFRLSFALNERGENLKLPNLTDFDVLMGPSQSTSQQFSNINGKMTQSVTYSYTYILRAKKTGKFRVLPASINARGKTYQSNALEIEVVKGQTRQQQNQREQRVQTGKVSKKDLFVTVELDKSSVYEGEHVLATMKLYTRVNVNNLLDQKFPAFTGFWTQDLDNQEQAQLKREVYKGEVYHSATIKKTLLYPQQSGKIKIEPFELVCQVMQQRRGRSLFDDFFETPTAVKVTATSKPVTLNVKPLPQKPADFSGAVGNFKIKSTIDKTKMKTNDAVALRVTISGNGNIQLVESPKVDFPADFEIYDPKSNTSSTSTAKGTVGTTTFEYIFQPRSAGTYTIPAVSFTYFNPKAKKFVTKSTQPYTIEVEKGDDAENATVVSSFSKEDVRFIGKDIRYIKLDNYKLKQKGETFFGTMTFYLWYLLIVIALAIVYFVNQKRIKDNANVALVKNKRASKLARKHLKQAASFQKANKQEEFYDAVLKAFWGYLADKLNIEVANLNKSTAVTNLTAHRVDEELVKEFIDIVETCEFARFAPSAANANMDEIYSKAGQVMNKIDKQIRKN